MVSTTGILSTVESLRAVQVFRHPVKPFMVFPGLAVDAKTMDAAETDQDAMGQSRPPIDRKTPENFQTASFGLG